MSALSDALDRMLKQVQNPTPIVKAPVQKPIFLKECSLYFKDGSSDKEYHIRITPTNANSLGHPLYTVDVRYGRRGRTLITETKTKQMVSQTEALRIFDKVRREKIAKGYSEN